MLKSYYRKIEHEADQLAFLPPARARAPSFALRWLEKPRLFLIAILLLVIALAFWSSVASIDRVVRVEGDVIPSARSQQIQHLEGGMVASVNVVEGAKVNKGDLLLTIDDTSANADMNDASEKLIAARARIIRLQAETGGKEKLDFPPDLAHLPAAKAEVDLFEARKRKLIEEVSVHQNAIKQQEGDIVQATQQFNNLNIELKTAQTRLTMEQGMAAQQAASKMEVLDAQSHFQQLNTEVNGVQASIPKFQAAIAEEQSRIRTARAEFDSQAHDDLVASIHEVERYKQATTTATDRLKRTEVRAPVDGTINHINVHTVGGVVKPGETLIELTPSTQEILIEAKTIPRDRGYLRTGLEAHVRISAYDSTELGLLTGQLTEVGADSIEDSHGTHYYQTNILIKSLPQSYTGHAIVPGMTATADIVTGRRTVLAYLLSPVSEFSYNMFKDPR